MDAGNRDPFGGGTLTEKRDKARYLLGQGRGKSPSKRATGDSSFYGRTTPPVREKTKIAILKNEPKKAPYWCGTGNLVGGGPFLKERKLLFQKGEEKEKLPTIQYNKKIEPSLRKKKGEEIGIEDKRSLSVGGKGVWRRKGVSDPSSSLC